MTDDEDTDPETACERIRNEATPLITDRRSLKATCTSRIWWTCLFSPYEPMTPKFRAEIPSPLMLLALGMGVTIIEACGILGSYTVLLANAQSVFPQCGKYKILDRVFGMTTQVGWMCEISSLFLFYIPSGVHGLPAFFILLGVLRGSSLLRVFALKNDARNS